MRSLEGLAARRLAALQQHRAPDQGVVLAQDELKEGISDLGVDDLVSLRHVFRESRFVLRRYLSGEARAGKSSQGKSNQVQRDPSRGFFHVLSLPPREESPSSAPTRTFIPGGIKAMSPSWTMRVPMPLPSDRKS